MPDRARIHDRRPGGEPLLLALVLAMAATGCADAPPPPRVILLTVDTLRADHLGAWGYPGGTSPFLDRLASEGLRFDQATASFPRTGPSFASIFTASHAREHRLMPANALPIPAAMGLVAEEIDELGFATQAVVANAVLAEEFGFAQGFDRYVEAWEGTRAGDFGSVDATRVTDLALAAARRIDPARPFLLWVHYLDPHSPYAPPPRVASRFPPESIGRRPIHLPGRLHRRFDGLLGHSGDTGAAPDRDLRRLVSRYDAEIAHTDREIERLWRGLETMGLLEGAVALFAADHGESLGDHDYYMGHGNHAYQCSLHVPLILHAPGRVRRGVVRRPVELLDIAPTLLEAAGVELPERRWRRGRSLLRFAGGGRETNDFPAVVVSRAGHRDGDRLERAVRRGRWKLIVRYHRPAPQAEPRPTGVSLFDLVDDRGEWEDRAAARPERVAALRRLLERWQRREMVRLRVDAPGAVDTPAQMSAGTRAHLEALGYL